ncbi:MAG: hypothetical protein C0501_00875 [Isosphaera sp.]|nr:hypothetical protein [Isosphaera sp.]
MRLFRPALLFVLLCTVAVAASAPVRSQPGMGKVNSMVWGAGSPSAETGGVGVTVVLTATKGWSCTELTVRVIDDATSKTLAEDEYTDPTGTVAKTYTGLGSNVKVRVTAMSTFQSGSAFEFRDLEETVTTK